jgi:hypothetical protein
VKRRGWVIMERYISDCFCLRCLASRQLYLASQENVAYLPVFLLKHLRCTVLSASEYRYRMILVIDCIYNSR